MEQPQERKPQNVFEQIVFGLEVVNNNVVDLYRKIDEIHAALFHTMSTPEQTNTEMQQ